MKTYNFNTLKNKAVTRANTLMGGKFAENSEPAIVASILTSDLEKNGLSWRENYAELKAQVIKRIDNWDVRCVKSLINLFPEIVNKAHAAPDAPCEVTMNDSAKWEVIFH